MYETKEDLDVFASVLADKLKTITRRIIGATPEEKLYIVKHLILVQQEEWSRHPPAEEAGGRYLNLFDTVFSAATEVAQKRGY